MSSRSNIRKQCYKKQCDKKQCDKKQCDKKRNDKKQSFKKGKALNSQGVKMLTDHEGWSTALVVGGVANRPLAESGAHPGRFCRSNDTRR